MAAFESYCHYDTHSADLWQKSRVGLAKESSYLKRKSLLTVLRAAHIFEATDPRDHVYAFLGCPYAQSEDGQPVVEADYTISTDEVYIRAARTLLRNPEEGPWILPAVVQQNRRRFISSTCPSWVPRWDQEPNRTTLVASPAY